MASKYIHDVAFVKAALPQELISRFEESDYLRALHAREGNITEVTTVLQKYAHIKKDYPSLYAKMTKQNVERALDGIIFAPVPGLKTKDGLLVTYYDVGSWDPSRSSCEDLAALFTILADLASILNPDAHEPGYAVLWDMHRMSMKHVTATPPRTYARNCCCLYESLISQQKKNYHIKFKMMEEIAFKAMNPFLPKGMKDNTIHLKKEQLIDLLGKDTVLNKKYIPTDQDVAVYRKFVKDNLPMIIAKYEKIML